MIQIEMEIHPDTKINVTRPSTTSRRIRMKVLNNLCLYFLHFCEFQALNGRLTKNHIVNMAVVSLSLMSTIIFHQAEF